MEARPLTHPPTDAQAFGLGKLTDLSAEAILRHLESCPDCRKQVAALSGDDFLDRLRQAHGRGETPVSVQTLSEAARNVPPTSTALPTPPSLAGLPPELASHPQYELLRELGRGGMGVVYLARNRLLARLEVLKVVNQELLDHAGGKERFLREMQSAAMLSHPNVVAAYSTVQVGDLLVFGMEYIEGEDLAKRVKTHGPLPVVNACYYAQQVALGLQHAFEKGMVHRDIKPQNLILSREGKKHVVKILDFGLAKATSEKHKARELTGTGMMLGTPDYMAPEQILDASKADIRADIYSLGCTLYYLLSGGPPFQADSLFQLLYAHQSLEAPLLHQVRPEVPAKLALVVSRMMAKQPGERYQTPAEVAQALTPFLKKGGAGSSSSASVGTGSTSRMEKSADQGKPKPAVIQDKPAAAEDSLTENSPMSTDSQKREVRRKRKSPAGKNRLLWVGAAACVLLLGLVGLWASGVLRVKTKEGILVVEINEPDAEVFVDGEKVTVTWGKDGKTAEVGVKPGTRKVEVKKDGFVARGEEVEIQADGRTVFRAHLEPLASQARLSLRPLNRMGTVGSGQWSIEGDQLIQQDARVQFADILFGDYEWTEYDFSAQVKRVEGNDFFALYGRWFDGNAFKCAAGVFGNRQALLWTLDQGGWTEVRRSPFNLQNDVLYKTVLRVRGHQYQAIINNQVIADYLDPVHVSGQGRIGLGTCTSGYRFTKIEVRSSTGKLLWTGPPEIDPPKPAAGNQPAAVDLEPLGVPEPTAPSKPLLPGTVLVGFNQSDAGVSAPYRIEITEREGDRFKGIASGDGWVGMRTFALAGTVRGSDVKFEIGNVLTKQGKSPVRAANNLSFVGKFERGTLEGRNSTHDEKFKATLKLGLAAVYTGSYEIASGAKQRRSVRIEITERQENHFKGTLTSDDGPTTWGITGTVVNGEVQWQWGDMASKEGSTSENLTNNCRFAGTCKDGIVQGRFSTLDNAQTGSLRAVLVKHGERGW